MTTPRAIHKAFLAREQSEGVGARVRRSIGTPNLPTLSPFIMLDHFTSSPGAGFPDHPHRGQETITYMLSGSTNHEDFTGASGTIHAGDLQFMTAGRGIMHSEMPQANEDGSPAVGMQLWVDLPEKLKGCEPRYRDLRKEEIPMVRVDEGRVSVKVISGQSHGLDSVRELAYTPVWIFDVEVKPGGRLVQELPAGWNAFAYTLEGSTAFGAGSDKVTVGKYHNVIFEKEGASVAVEVGEDEKEDARFCEYPLICLTTEYDILTIILMLVLVAGLPLDQKVVQYGPFVLNSEDGVHQAMMDFQTHSNGFERAKGWRSEIGKSMAL
ncbi:MAG: hypothetical protein Q9226_004277 [Calogaya cf. arnoldii]